MYTECVLKETLRLYSVVPIVAREAVADDELGGYFIARGTRIFVHIQRMHEDARLWPEPLAFRPERFAAPDGARNSSDSSSATQPAHRRQHAFNPFINGPRSCVGQFFSLLESKIVLAQLVRQFDIAPTLPANVAGQRHPYVLPYAPLHGLPVRATQRPR